jgi:hypothetical protein
VAQNISQRHGFGLAILNLRVLLPKSYLIINIIYGNGLENGTGSESSKMEHFCMEDAETLDCGIIVLV